MAKIAFPLIKWFKETGMHDVGEVGGKNASLGEMINSLTPLGVNVPNGFATTVHAYRTYLAANQLEGPIRETLDKFKKGDITLEEASRTIWRMIVNGVFPTPLANSIREAYDQLSIQYDTYNIDVAVRSSATAEDLPTASFAGLQESFLNISGAEELLNVCKRCFASLFTERAIAYREERGFDHMKIALCVGVQKMIRADRSGSGVMFTLDTETGFRDIVLINAAWGLGENVVRGMVNPDQYIVFKPLLDRPGIKPILEKRIGSKKLKMIYNAQDNGHTRNVVATPKEQRSLVLSDSEILQLARWAVLIESHYQVPMDIEWVKDDVTGSLFIVQARPETVHATKNDMLFKSYKLVKNGAPVILKGLSIGNAMVHGNVCRADHISDLSSLKAGDILVAQMTEPDWVPAMKKAAGIITDFGGRTCHAAIVSRELGIPAVVGTKEATSILENGKKITLSCAGGEEGVIYDGWLDFEVEEIDLDKLPAVQTHIMLNLATPESAFKWWKLPVRGVGLARMEFIINNHIKIHPMALVNFEAVTREEEREKIRKLTRGYRDRKQYFVDRLAEGIARIAASQYPNSVIVRTSDFKTNEYARLIGGSGFEPREENPMLGWRGASRYYSEAYREGFALECRALKKVREQIGLENVIVMIPFCRTLREAEWVLAEMKKNGLSRGECNLQVYMMCEIPSNYILLEEFAQYFDGFSIGSNDLTQLILGVDRDSSSLAYLFDENDPAVKKAIGDVIRRARNKNCKVGFCGQAPSDDPAYAAFLVQSGIDSISLNPDSVVRAIYYISESETERKAIHV